MDSALSGCSVTSACSSFSTLSFLASSSSVDSAGASSTLASSGASASCCCSSCAACCFFLGLGGRRGPRFRPSPWRLPWLLLPLRRWARRPLPSLASSGLTSALPPSASASTCSLASSGTTSGAASTTSSFTAAISSAGTALSTASSGAAATSSSALCSLSASRGRLGTWPRRPRPRPAPLLPSRGRRRRCPLRSGAAPRTRRRDLVGDCGEEVGLLSIGVDGQEHADHDRKIRLRPGAGDHVHHHPDPSVKPGWAACASDSRVCGP